MRYLLSITYVLVGLYIAYTMDGLAGSFLFPLLSHVECAQPAYGTSLSNRYGADRRYRGNFCDHVEMLRTY